MSVYRVPMAPATRRTSLDPTAASGCTRAELGPVPRGGGQGTWEHPAGAAAGNHGSLRNDRTPDNHALPACARCGVEDVSEMNPVNMEERVHAVAPPAMPR